MKKLLLIALSIGSFSLITNCKKGTDTGNGVCPITMTSLVGSYKITAITLENTSTGAKVDTFTDPACSKDDIITLKADGTYTWSDGATSCTPPNVLPAGTWSVNGNVLITDGVGVTVTFDCKTLVGKHTSGNMVETTMLVKQ